jgi:Ran GTPase-activating protein (RanGAP) involved in mRNA processing and transport
MLHPKSNCNIEILKLDHNEFGSKGMIALSEGLAICKSLKNLSLTYCNIDASGARSIFEILIYSGSKFFYINDGFAFRSTWRNIS